MHKFKIPFFIYFITTLSIASIFSCREDTEILAPSRYEALYAGKDVLLLEEFVESSINLLKAADAAKESNPKVNFTKIGSELTDAKDEVTYLEIISKNGISSDSRLADYYFSFVEKKYNLELKYDLTQINEQEKIAIYSKINHIFTEKYGKSTNLWGNCFEECHRAAVKDLWLDCGVRAFISGFSRNPWAVVASYGWCAFSRISAMYDCYDVCRQR